MKSDKRQTYLLIGLVLIVMAGAFAGISLSQPKLYSEPKKLEVKVITSDTSNAETKAQKSSIEVNYPLNINTATLEELMTIDGLGEKRASAIIEYRNNIGKYTSVDQILQIEGFGEETYKQVAGYLTV